MNSEGSVTRWIGQMKSGDDAAMAKIFERYYPRLVGLARRKLGVIRRATDEEDVAQSAFWGFYQSLKENRLSRLNNREDLFGLLIVITARKAANAIARELTQKRGAGQVEGESAIGLLAGTLGSGCGAEQAADSIKPPDEQAMLAESYERYLSALPTKELRDAAEMYLAGYTHEQIAQHFGRSVRTIERWVHLILTIWRDLGEQEDDA